MGPRLIPGKEEVTRAGIHQVRVRAQGPDGDGTVEILQQKLARCSSCKPRVGGCTLGYRQRCPRSRVAQAAMRQRRTAPSRQDHTTPGTQHSPSSCLHLADRAGHPSASPIRFTARRVGMPVYRHVYRHGSPLTVPTLRWRSAALWLPGGAAPSPAAAWRPPAPRRTRPGRTPPAPRPGPPPGGLGRANACRSNTYYEHHANVQVGEKETTRQARCGGCLAKHGVGLPNQASPALPHFQLDWCLTVTLRCFSEDRLPPYRCS